MTPTSRITLATVIAAVLTGDRWELFGCRSPFENFVAEEPCCANQAQTLRNSMRAGRSLKRVAAQAHVRSRPKRPCNATLGGAIQNGHAACPDRLSLKSNPCSQANRGHSAERHGTQEQLRVWPCHAGVSAVCLGRPASENVLLVRSDRLLQREA